MTRSEIRKILRHWAWPLASLAVLLMGVGIGLTIGSLREPAVIADNTEKADLPPAAKPSARAPAPVVRLPAEEGPAAAPAAPPVAEASEAVNPALPPKVAALPTFPPLPPREGPPAWMKAAVTAHIPPGKALVAVVIDDLGLDKKRSSRTTELPGPLTMAFMPYADDLAQQTARARARGHELLVHVPMEPEGQGYDPGPLPLLVDLPPEEIRRRLDHDLSRFEGFVGFNNHMGSRFTSNLEGMAVVIDEARKRGLLFLDSKTSEQSVGGELARRAGLPYAVRDVFLDNNPDVGAVRGQLAKLEDVARKRGYAIAIGHPRDGTIAALSSWLPTLEGKGLALAPLSAIVKLRQGTKENVPGETSFLR